MDDDFVEYASASRLRLIRLALRITGDQHAAQDLVQEALARTWASWSKVRAKDQPDAYLRRVMLNLYLRHQRRYSGRERLTDAVPEPPLGAAATDEVDERQRVWKAIQLLPARQKLVVVLRYYEDLSEADIAAVLECEPGTVKSQLHKAMGHLRVSLPKESASGAAGRESTDSESEVRDGRRGRHGAQGAR